jgi:predicted ribosomally synthesized peptide with SipW-like signal peptide
MKRTLSRKVLMSIGVVAGIGALAGVGTFASFTAQTANPNTFANGTAHYEDTEKMSTAARHGPVFSVPS